MLWILPDQLIALSYFEIGKFETWGDRTSDDGPRLPIGHMGSEPMPGRDDGLKNLSRIGIVSQQETGISACFIDDMHEKGRAGVEVP
jgi:hypothetical protein